MRFSIIIPVYNCEDYLAEAIESALHQTYNDFEIILVDDGSKDGSGSICERYKNSHPGRISVVHQENSGPLAARRAGYHLANGEMILSLDGDDALRHDALQRINEILTLYDVDLIIFGMSRKSDFSTLDSGKLFDTDCYITDNDKIALIHAACSSSNLNSMCSKAFKRELLDYDVDYQQYGYFYYAEDLLQSLPLIEKASTAYYLNEPLYYYRVNYGSSTKRFNTLQLEQRLVVWNIQIQYAQKWAKEYGDFHIVTETASSGLMSFAEVVQAASEGLSYLGAKHFLQDQTLERGFQRAYELGASAKNLRIDYRLIVHLYRKRLFCLIVALSKAKRQIRKAIGR